MQIVIVKNPEEVASYGASIFINQIQSKPDSVLGLATGSTPLLLYKKLIAACQAGTISFNAVASFNLDEYLDLPEEHPQSYRQFMEHEFFKHIDINRSATRVPNGCSEDPWQACAEYEAAIANKGGIDLQLLGIGRNGHIGFNEPSSGLRSRTRIKTLSEATIRDNARFFTAEEQQPTLSITMGIGTILDSKKVVLMATGKHKAEAIQQAIEGPLTAACPASALQMHRDSVVIIDDAAASHLDYADYYRHVEQQNQKLLMKYGKSI